MPKMLRVQAIAGDNPFAKERNVLHVVLKKSVCKICNGGWMGRLETSFLGIFSNQLAKPVLRRLDPIMQERVATWAAKTALLLMLYTEFSSLGSSGYVPDDNLRWFYDHQNPPSLPPGTKVWIGTVANPGNRPMFHQAAALGVGPNDPVTAYFATFTLGYFIFQVFGHDVYDAAGVLSMNPPVMLPNTLSGTLVEIWPGNGDDIIWPTSSPVFAEIVPRLHHWPSGIS